MDLVKPPKVLVLTHRVPFPPDKGDRIRTYHILKWLSARATVHLACLADEPVDRATRTGLEALCERTAIVPHQGRARWARGLGSFLTGGTVSLGVFHSPRLRAVVEDWAGEHSYASVFASASSLVPYLRLNVLRNVPSVVDLVDVDSQKWLDYANSGCGPMSWLYRTEGHRLRRVERDLATSAHAVTLVSEAERTLYRQACAVSSRNVHAISNGVDFDYFHPAGQDVTVDETGCVFVGALDYRPNVDGAVWFCREVWPEIRRRFPGATLTLVGRRPVPQVRRLADCPGVEVTGQVADVRPYVARAAVAVVPLRLARGVQNKVLEALAMSKAVVSSPQAVAGVRAGAGSDLLVAETPSAWVDSLSSLLRDPARRAQLGAAGRRYVERNHCWETCLNPFGSLFGVNAEPAEVSIEGSGRTL
jgi:polysaccharide biosynthesis protein PslH